MQLDLQSEKGMKKTVEKTMIANRDISVKYDMVVTELEAQHQSQPNIRELSVPIPKPRQKLVTLLKAENENLQQTIN